MRTKVYLGNNGAGIILYRELKQHVSSIISSLKLTKLMGSSQFVLSLGSGDDLLHVELTVHLSLHVTTSATTEVRGQPWYGNGRS